MLMRAKEVSQLFVEVLGCVNFNLLFSGIKKLQNEMLTSGTKS